MKPMSTRADGTGVIMAVLGMETSSGDFEVIDLCFAGLPEIYRPPSDAPYLNGKGKSKAKEEAMEVDGELLHVKGLERC